MDIPRELSTLRVEVARLRDAGEGNPRIHPNGFIQLDLEPGRGNWAESHQRGHSGAARRLHIWNPPGIELPRQETVNEIHDHVFDMFSTVFRGRLTQKLYQLVIGRDSSIYPEHIHTLDGKFEVYKAIYNKTSDSRLEPTGITGLVDRYCQFDVRAGGSYKQPAFSFHDTGANDGLLVTVMRKMDVHDGDAHVICPADTPPDNSYDRASAAPAELLWEAIERSIA